MKIEIITPCYCEEKCIKPFYDEIKRVFENYLSDYDFLITYVDDGSRDDTLNEIKRIKMIDENHVRYISLSRNFGKEAAIYAGLSNCVGECVALLDVDLQHPPVLLSEMLSAIVDEGYDCATARRVSRKGEPVFRSFLSKNFYHAFNWLTAIELMPGSTDYRLMKKDVADAIVEFGERERFTKGIYSWIGFKNKWVEYENVERVEGKTKWSLKGLLHYSYNGFMAFATTPLRGMVYLGMLIVAIVVVWIFKILYDFIFRGLATGGGITTLTLITLFLGGVIIMLLGVVGEYLARIYLEIKHRPIYIAKESDITDVIKTK